MFVLRKKKYLNRFLVDVLLLYFYASSGKKENIGQKLDNQYPKKGKYEVALKFSKILNQV